MHTTGRLGRRYRRARVAVRIHQLNVIEWQHVCYRNICDMCVFVSCVYVTERDEQLNPELLVVRARPHNVNVLAGSLCGLRVCVYID